MSDLQEMQKAMVQQNCQETTKMGMIEENDDAHMDDDQMNDGMGTRTFCHVRLTMAWQDCRMQCHNLTMMASMSCKYNNWSTYLSACFQGNDTMKCAKLPTDSSVTTVITSTTTGITSTTTGITSLTTGITSTTTSSTSVTTSSTSVTTSST